MDRKQQLEEIQNGQNHGQNKQTRNRAAAQHINI